MIISKSAEELQGKLLGKVIKEGVICKSKYGDILRCNPIFAIVENPDYVHELEYDFSGYTICGEKYTDRVEESINMAMQKLKSTPFTRRVSIPIWKAKDHLCKTPPAITEISFIVYDNRLNATTLIRSLDVLNYFSFNFDFINYVVDLILDKTEFEKGSVAMLISIPHVYMRDLDRAKVEKDEYEEIYGVTEHGTHIVEDYLSSAWHSVLEAIYSEGKVKKTEWGEMFEGQAESKFLHRMFIEVKNPYENQIHDKAPFTRKYGVEYAHDYVICAKSIDKPINESILREDETYTYAERARYCEKDDVKVDQLYTVIEKLKEDKFRRDCYVGISRPWDLLSDEPPCLRGYQFFALNNETLAGLFYMRSNDAYGAMHANAYAFSLLTQYVAEMTGFHNHVYYHFAVDMHIYAEFLNAVKEILQPETPTIHDIVDFKK
ncbi:thymidylate synthase [Archaeoglobales archaeon]|nr:MAG: thymidylate synthase [Archaeoglobales archaeon]